MSDYIQHYLYDGEEILEVYELKEARLGLLRFIRKPKLCLTNHRLFLVVRRRNWSIVGAGLLMMIITILILPLFPPNIAFIPLLLLLVFGLLLIILGIFGERKTLEIRYSHISGIYFYVVANPILQVLAIIVLIFGIPFLIFMSLYTDSYFSPYIYTYTIQLAFMIIGTSILLYLLAVILRVGVMEIYSPGLPRIILIGSDEALSSILRLSKETTLVVSRKPTIPEERPKDELEKILEEL